MSLAVPMEQLKELWKEPSLAYLSDAQRGCRLGSLLVSLMVVLMVQMKE